MTNRNILFFLSVILTAIVAYSIGNKGVTGGVVLNPTPSLSIFKFPDNGDYVNKTYVAIKLKTDSVYEPIYLNTYKLHIPRKYADEIEVYATDKNAAVPIVIAPKSWSGESRIGQNGSQGIDLYPRSKNDQKTEKIEIGANQNCYSCILGAAAEYGFESAAKKAKEKGLIISTPIPGLIKHEVTSKVIKYELPNREGLEINGVVFYSLPEQFSGESGFARMEVIMAPEKHDYAIYLLEAFLENLN